MFNKKANILRQPKIYSPPKEQKKFVLPKIVKILIIFVVVLLAVIYSLFFSPLFRITHIQIVGNMPQEANALTERAKGANIFLFDAAGLENNFKKNYPQYLAIVVSRGIPNTLRIKFTERKTQILWLTQEKKYLVDENGIIFNEAKEANYNDLPQVKDNKNLPVELSTSIASPNFINFIKEANIKLKDSGLTIKEFQINETTFQTDTITDQGFKLIFDTTRPLIDQLDAFQKVYNEHKSEIKEYMDLRVEGWVYYK